VTPVAPNKPNIQSISESSPKTAEPVRKVEAVVPPPAESLPATSLPETAPTPPVQTAVATPTETIFNRTAILIAAVVLLLVALGLVYAMMRRPRTTEKVSLITRSMDRDEK
jgi:hypothetical protein